MKNVLVLGAGQSSPYLIRHLLDHSEAGGFTVTVADRGLELPELRIAGHPRGRAKVLDVRDAEALAEAVRDATVVVHLLPPPLLPTVARACLSEKRSLVSASYRPREILDLASEAEAAGLVFQCEMGLDPGIDLMSAAELLAEVDAGGGVVEAFRSYGSGVPAPDSAVPPLNYAVTWNPRNVVMAAEHGAQYLLDGALRVVPWSRIFFETWEVEVAGVGPMEAYANRDSVGYRQSLGLDEVQTLVRGTLRYPGFCEIWSQVVRLGLPNERYRIPGLGSLSPRDLVQIFLPRGETSDRPLEERVATFLGISPTGHVLSGLEALGLFGHEPLGCAGETAAAALASLLSERLALPKDGRDMVVLLHDVTARYPEEGGRRRRIRSTLVEKGERGGMTAMSRTVGLPAAIAVRRILDGSSEAIGCPLPTRFEIYRPVLADLAADGISFETETVDLA